METKFKNVHIDKDFTKNSAATVREYTKTLKTIRTAKDFSVPESALFIAEETEYQQAIKRDLARFKGVKYVVLIGIGGSSLGTEAVFAALKTEKSPELIVVDSIEQDSFEHFLGVVSTLQNEKEIVVVVNSKSGGTTETILNASRVIESLEKRFAEKADAQIILIGNEDGVFEKIAQKRNILNFTLPESIGGRFSVFSAVGIVPLTLLGIDVVNLRKGVTDALSDKNLATAQKSAIAIAQYAKRGFHTVNFFAFNKRLTLLGYWYRQLFAESVGRKETRKGLPFIAKLNPAITTSADLHSVAELYLGGYQGVYTRFFYSTESFVGVVSKKQWLIEAGEFLGGKKVVDVKSAIIQSVLKAYDGEKLPYEEVSLSKINAYEVGYLMASCMLEVVFFAAIFDINPFIQPSVEKYKKHIRAFLNTK